jgi:hypothetical protein
MGQLALKTLVVVGVVLVVMLALTALAYVLATWGAETT